MKFDCSSFSWFTKDNKHLLGRTYDEFGDLRKNKIVVIPRNYKINLEINNYNNICYGIYSFVGMAVLGLNTPIFTDGINEKGLMGALLYYPGFAHYNSKSIKNAININPGFFITYILSKCATINEVLIEINNINFINELVFGEEIPVHYIFSDRSGESIIIEPDKRGISVYRNSMGVLTNSPSYFWQIQNLRNYLGITNVPRQPQTVVNYQISQFGEGTGGLGLPGDYTPVSRFVRLAFLKQFAVQGENEVEGITKMLRNFASVEIPEGIIKDLNKPNYVQTLCTSCMCSESLIYYFKLSCNSRINAINLEHEKNNKQVKCFNLPLKEDILFLN
ncbi:linear amide C-N hydrolase [Clostridium botulinum]|uniref:Penicillin amidase n=1 Tax=Clostridium botulinum TaxID=1491 RepID=A0A9Q1ZDJ5_CLOBO|nr:choloylglycine hydrolase family protein [Clostridium botulinum]AEB77446.1 putative penicillin amidase [Clostridium botulinum BKT015925]KEH96040.1 putative penicillin amidase [Clostridium botulinum C/D str. Sp77]KEH96973.1 penicillin amidase [Clostridium botulinum D str. 16868]KLU74614.1 penicillin amidase [Clostridium botulinum V891]KOA74142.1 penicillin amidase [Clostridium botulinum]